MFKKLRLGPKFMVILVIIFLGGIGLSGVLLSSTAHQQAEQQVAVQATLLMEMTDAVRNYTNQQVQPLLLGRVDSAPAFIPEAIPSYTARQTFEYLRKQSGYGDFLYKDAAPNPTNLRDQANAFETGLVQKFRQNPALKQLTGFQNVGGKSLFYVSRPLTIQDPSCLRCHSVPSRAPKSQIVTYGADHGFGWKLNQVVAAQTVYVTAEDVFQSYYQQLLLMMGVFVGIFAIVLFVINLSLNRMVIQPIIPMARLTQSLSHGRDSDDQNGIDRPEEQEATDFRKLEKVARRSDELGQLAGLFRQMTSVISTREDSMKQLVEKLRHETNIARKALTAARSNNGVNVADLIQRSRRSRLQAEHQPQNLAALFRTVHSFQSFNDQQIQRLIQLGSQIPFVSQEIICHEDEPGNTFYIILTGSVEVYVAKLPKDLRILKAGNFFGEVSLLLGIPRTATVRTLEPTVLFAVNQTDFQILLQEHPRLAETVAQQLAENKAEFEQRKDSLRKHGLLKDENIFNQNLLAWIRDRIKQTFN